MESTEFINDHTIDLETLYLSKVSTIGAAELYAHSRHLQFTDRVYTKRPIGIGSLLKLYPKITELADSLSGLRTLGFGSIYCYELVYCDDIDVMRKIVMYVKTSE